MQNRIKELLRKYSVQIGFILVIAAGLLAAMVPFGTSDTEITGADGNSELYTYTENLEKRLEEIIRNVRGAGKTTAMVTFESSFESVYASNARLEENSGDVSAKTTEKEMVLAGGRDSAQEPVLLKEICPRVKGVFVVCEGGGDMTVVQHIKKAVSALFGISETKICVTEGSGDA